MLRIYVYYSSRVYFEQKSTFGSIRHLTRPLLYSYVRAYNGFDPMTRFTSRGNYTKNRFPPPPPHTHHHRRRKHSFLYAFINLDVKNCWRKSATEDKTTTQLFSTLLRAVALKKRSSRTHTDYTGLIISAWKCVTFVSIILFIYFFLLYDALALPLIIFRKRPCAVRHTNAYRNRSTRCCKCASEPNNVSTPMTPCLRGCVREFTVFFFFFSSIMRRAKIDRKPAG